MVFFNEDTVIIGFNVFDFTDKVSIVTAVVVDTAAATTTIAAAAKISCSTTVHVAAIVVVDIATRVVANSDSWNFVHVDVVVLHSIPIQVNRRQCIIHKVNDDSAASFPNISDSDLILVAIDACTVNVSFVLDFSALGIVLIT